jgi:hypothetical protein
VTSERDKWPPLVNTVMKFRVRYIAGIFLTDCRTREFLE